MGLSIERLAAIMAVLRNAGVKASTIGTGLTSVFTQLIQGGSKLETQLQMLD